MARIITAGAVGAVVYFIWGMLAWMAIPLHTPTIRGLPDEQTVVDALKQQNLDSGVYVAPFSNDTAELSDPESEFMKRHTAGPIFSIYFQPEGQQPMSAGVMVVGFLIDLLAALLAACLLANLGPRGTNYWWRVGFVAALGFFVAVVGHLSYWNWMHFPLGYTLGFVVDVTVGWTLAGLAIAAIVRPQAEAATADQTSVESKPKAQVAAKPKPVPKASKPAAPIRSDAISLLATLQREARFIDIVKEPLGDYTDAQVGAAARDVLRDCGTVLDRLFQLEPVVEEEEGAVVEVPSDADAGKYRFAGNASGGATSGALVHHGWKARQCELPKWTGAKEAALIVVPAELDVK